MRNIKRILALVVSISLVFALTACGKKDGASSDAGKLEQIKESGKLVLGTSADYPPFEFHKEINGKDEIVGFDIEIAKAMAEELGVELEIKDMKFDGLLAALNAGKVDIVIAGMNPTEDRKAAVDFSEIYYREVQSVVVRAESADLIKTLDDLKGKKVAVQKGTTMEAMAQQHMAESEIKGLGRVTDVVLELKNKKVEAVVMEKPVAKAYVAANPELKLTEIELEPEDTGFAVAVKKGNADLVAKTNEILKSLMDQGKIDEFVADANKLMEE